MILVIIIIEVIVKIRKVISRQAKYIVKSFYRIKILIKMIKPIKIH